MGDAERRARRVLGHTRPTQRYKPVPAEDEKALTEEIVDLAGQIGRYGYRRITALLRQRGWHVNHKRVERIWRREGLKVPAKQPKRGRLWFNDGSCVRLRPAWKDHVWAYDFVYLRLHDGTEVRLLTETDQSVSVFWPVAKEARTVGKPPISALLGLLSRYRWIRGRAWKEMGMGVARRRRSGARQVLISLHLLGKTHQIQNNGHNNRPRPPPRPSLSFRRLSRPHHHHCQDGIGSSRHKRTPSPHPPASETLSATPVLPL